MCAAAAVVADPFDLVAWGVVVDNQDHLAAQEEGEGQVEFEDVADDADLGPVESVLLTDCVEHFVVLDAVEMTPASLRRVWWQQVDGRGHVNRESAERELLGVAAEVDAVRVHAHDLELVLDALGAGVGDDGETNGISQVESGHQLNSS